MVQSSNVMSGCGSMSSKDIKGEKAKVETR